MPPKSKRSKTSKHATANTRSKKSKHTAAAEALADIAAGNGGELEPHIKLAYENHIAQLQDSEFLEDPIDNDNVINNDKDSDDSDDESVPEEGRFADVKDINVKLETQHVKKKGRHFSPEEDLLVARAFVSASTDGLISTNRSKQMFIAEMQKNYKTLVAEAKRAQKAKLRKALLERENDDSDSEVAVAGVSKVYPDRDGTSIYNRFMNTLSPRCQKWKGLEAQFPAKSGEDYHKWQARLMPKYYELFNHSFERFQSVKEYLEQQPKWKQLVSENDKENEDAKPAAKKKGTKGSRGAERGNTKGGKALLRAKEEQDMVDRALLQVQANRENQGEPSMYQNKIMTFLDAMTTHLATQTMEQWTEEQRTEYYAAQQRLALSQMARAQAENERIARSIANSQDVQEPATTVASSAAASSNSSDEE